MDLDGLQLALEVARRGSFAAVAADRGVDPSSVSRGIAALELALGARLFQRTTRRLVLTEAGERYLERIAPLLADLQTAGDDLVAATGRLSGTVRLTSSVAFGQCRLVPLLPDLRTLYPDLRLELVLTDRNLDLVTERIDLAVRLAPRIEGDLVAVRLQRTRYRVCAAPSWIERFGRPRAPEELAGASCVLLDLPGFRDAWRFRSAGEPEREVRVSGAVTVSTALALRQCARLGLGPALLADWLVDDHLAGGRLVDLFPEHEVAARDFATAAWLVYPSRRQLPARTRAVIDFLRRSLRAR